jgi:hypothetical protein
MSNSSVSYAVNGAAASNVTDGATTYVPPGASVTVALQSSTGIKRWRFKALSLPWWTFGAWRIRPIRRMANSFKSDRNVRS